MQSSNSPKESEACCIVLCTVCIYMYLHPYTVALSHLSVSHSYSQNTQSMPLPQDLACSAIHSGEGLPSRSNSRLVTCHSGEGLPSRSNSRLVTCHSGEGLPSRSNSRLVTCHSGEGLPSISNSRLVTFLLIGCELAPGTT